MENRSEPRLIHYFHHLLTWLKQMRDNQSTKTVHHYSIGTPCYALYYGPKRDQQPKWVEAVDVKVFGSRTVNVRVYPRGPTWKRHLEQFCPRYSSKEDAEPPEEIPCTTTTSQPLPLPEAPDPRPQTSRQRNPRLPNGHEYTRDNPRHSKNETRSNMYNFKLAGRC